MQIYGLIGYPVKHSLSPLMHNAAFKKIGMPAEYRLFELKPEELEDFLLKNIPVKDTAGNSFSSQDIIGFNITIPHKVKAREILEKKFPFPFASLILPEVYYIRSSGAVNTVKRNTGKLEYRNTDTVGFLESLKEDLKFNTENKNILLIGCGGGGRAVIAALNSAQAKTKKIYISDINDVAINSTENYFSQSDFIEFPQIRAKLEFISNIDIPKVIGNCDLLVNATPCGMKESDPCVVDEKLIRRDLAVFDLIYNPKETKLLKIAREKGAATVNGLGMLLYQGACAFEFWTEEKAPLKEMREALNQGVKNL